MNMKVLSMLQKGSRSSHVLVMTGWVGLGLTERMRILPGVGILPTLGERADREAAQLATKISERAIALRLALALSPHKVRNHLFAIQHRLSSNRHGLGVPQAS